MAQTENHHCEICESDDQEPISTKGRDYLLTNTAICKNCGFVFISPRMSHTEYQKFYQTRYDKLYRTNNFGEAYDFEKVKSNPYGFEQVYQRLLPFTKGLEIRSILGIGSGDGNNLKYLGERLNAEQLFGIEPSIEGQECIAEREIKLVSTDVDDKWDERFGRKVDLVVLRHVFEHLPDINGTLTKIHSVLNEDGLLYMAVPNSYNIGKLALLRSFFRIVHLSYFSKKSLSNVLIKNRFKIVDIQEFEGVNTELFVVAMPVEESKEIHIDKEEYRRQLNYFNKFIKRESKILPTFRSLVSYLNRRYVILKSSKIRK